VERVSFDIHEAYPVLIERGLFRMHAAFGAELFSGRRVLLFATPTAHSIHGALVENFLADHAEHVTVEVISVEEADKSVETVLKLCASARRAGLGRRDLMVALGGGVLSDQVRLAAALIRRGIGHVCIPTTLIGQIDAAIGIKAGVNFEGAKSYLGTFHPPAAVLVDPDFLATLPQRHVRSGMAEILKVALTLDAELFNLLETQGIGLLCSRFTDPPVIADHVLARSISLCLEELGRDLFERGSLTRLLDFGHTFSPIIESRHRFAIEHGEAVAIDMCVSSAIAVELGLLAPAQLNRIVSLVRAWGLPCDDPFLNLPLLTEAIEAAIRHRDGAVNLVVPTAIGAATFIDRPALEPGLLARAIARLRGVHCDAQWRPHAIARQILPPRQVVVHPVRRPA